MRVVLWFFLMLGVLLAGPEAWAAKKKNSPPPPPKAIYEAPMTVVIVRSSDTACEPLCPEWISAEGEITDATPRLFRNVFKQMGKKQLPIIIRSPGGSINAAIEIGRMVRQRKLDVGVGYTDYKGCAPNQKVCKLPKDDDGVYRGNVQAAYAFCNSACPILLSGGVNRYASYGTTLGLHQPKTVWVQRPYQYVEHYRMVKGRKKVIDRKITKWLPTKTKVTFGFDKRLRKQLTSYYRSMGIDVAVLDESNKAAYKDINTITGLRAEELHLRTTPRSIEMLTAISVCNGTGAAANCVESDRKSDAELALLAGQKATKLERPLTKAWGMTLTPVRDTRRDCLTKCPEWIAADGVITSQTPALFRDLIKGLGDKRPPIVLNSSGGDVDAALAIGAMLREAKFDTGVAATAIRGGAPQANDIAADLQAFPRKGFIQRFGQCKGACVMVLAGGVSRMIDGYEPVAVNHPAAYVSADKQPVAVRLNLYFAAMGIKPDLIKTMWAIPQDGSKVLSDIELAAMGLETSSNIPEDALNPESCKSQGRGTYCVERR